MSTKVRVVIEEVVVDAECADTAYPGETMLKMVKACVEGALEAHAATKENSKS